jgi:hypothetical protein
MVKLFQNKGTILLLAYLLQSGYPSEKYQLISWPLGNFDPPLPRIVEGPVKEGNFLKILIEVDKSINKMD